MTSNRSLGEHYRVNFVIKVLVDVGLILILITATLLTYFKFRTHKRGYFCNDMSIRYPYQPETWSSTSLYLVSLAFPLIFLGMGEILFASEGDYEEDVDHFVGKWKVPKGFVRTYDVIVSFSFGFMVSLLICLISQTSLGVLRPNFREVCNPLEVGFDCNSPDDFKDLTYRVNFTCRNDEWKVDYARRGFPSKHASLTFYSMVYISVYLQKKVNWEYLSVFNNCVQVMFVTFAWVVSIYQIRDNYNRLEDILVGIVIGSIVAWFNVCAVYNFFKSGVRMSPETAPRTLEKN